MPQVHTAAPVAAAETNPSVNESKLAALGKAAEVSLAKAESVAAVKPADLAKVDEKLSSLLGNKK